MNFESDPKQLSSPATESQADSTPPKNAGRHTRLGIVLILLSGVLWFSLFAVPFLPLSVGNKAVLSGTLFAGVQVAWWSGAALAGPRVVSQLTGWMRRKQ